MDRIFANDLLRWASGATMTTPVGAKQAPRDVAHSNDFKELTIQVPTLQQTPHIHIARTRRVLLSNNGSPTWVVVLYACGLLGG